MHFVEAIFVFPLYSFCYILSNQITCLVKDSLLLHVKGAKLGLTWSQQRRCVTLAAKVHVLSPYNIEVY